MNQTINLSSQIQEYLPQQLLELVNIAAQKTTRLGQRLYLVGGVVRDLLLGRPIFDLDLVVEGDALKLAEELARVTQERLTTHRHFGTAKLSYKDFSIDITTARRETYAKPGALPTVQPGTITDDLFRRDFSINAMAICLNRERYGELIDPYNGKHDLDHRLIRVLHERSFIDDATRILRALRYEQRLGFTLESRTLQLLQRDIPMLDTISNERVRYDLELILKEEMPEQILKRAHQLGVLQKIYPSLKGNGWLAKKFQEARQLIRKSPPLPLYLSLLVYSLTETETEQFISRINPPKKLARALHDTLHLKKYLLELTEPSLKPSQIYLLLCEYTPTAIQANAIASDSSLIRQRLKLFLDKLRYVKPLLNGEDLKRIGIPGGPQLGEVLKVLHEAKLNGKVKTRRDEEKLVYSRFLR